MYDDAQNKTRKEDTRFLDVMMPQVVRKKTFTPVGVPGCELGATLVPETRVAAVQHIYIVSRQSLYLLHPPSAHETSSGKPGLEHE